MRMSFLAEPTTMQLVMLKPMAGFRFLMATEVETEYRSWMAAARGNKMSDHDERPLVAPGDLAVVDTALSESPKLLRRASPKASPKALGSAASSDDVGAASLAALRSVNTSPSTLKRQLASLIKVAGGEVAEPAAKSQRCEPAHALQAQPVQ